MIIILLLLHLKRKIMAI